MGKRILIVIIATVLVSSIVVGVFAMSKAPKPKEPFHIAFNEWVGFAPFFLAKEKGFFGDLQVDFDFIALEGDKRAGLYAGRFQMICETIDMFQTNRDNADYPGKIVFAVDESFGGDGIVAVREVKSLKDIKDRNVVSEPGLPAHFVLQYLLHKEGMTLNDVKLLDMTSADAAAAFIAGKADIAGTYEPYLSKALEKREGAHILVSSKDLPGLIVDVAIAGDKIMKDRKEDIAQIFIGWCKAVDYFENNRVEAIAIMAKTFKLTPEEFEDTISGLRYFGYLRNKELFGTEKKHGPVFKTFKDVGAILQENDLTEEAATPSSKIEYSIVNTPMK